MICGPLFVGANESLSAVVLTSNIALTSGASTHEGLYKWAAGKLAYIGSGRLGRLGGSDEADTRGAVSGDGSWVYFAANGALGANPGAVHGNCVSELESAGGECNLYAEHNDGSGWEAPKLIAVLSSEDAPDWGVDLNALTARVSPDGGYLAFMSQQRLTGYDNTDAASGKPNEEVYLYDAASESGGDVFFLTSAKLAPQDYDSSRDVYDAHECTTQSPCPPPAAEQPPSCTTEASCKPAPEPQPGIYGPPASATFNGPGNVAPTVSPPPAKKVAKKAAKCRKGFVKQHGRCVKRKKKSKNRKR